MDRQWTRCLLRITKGSNGSFLDLARRIVAFPFFLGIFRMEELLVFLVMVFLGGWLSGVFTCWLFAKMRRMFFPVKPQTDVMIQTDPFIAPGVCDLAVFPTGAKYHLPGCRHVQRRPRNASL